ncbi:serine/threonine-protein kinase [Actinocorallia longicatena]|uniref:Protein kinase domain-containing protein n=1 Tax=Actinocorallia longicatena TaxID=111803 RepID=A0ABP6QP88_9ACTN
MDESIGPYQLVNKIGRGGMGTVYLAKDPQGRDVAVKVINAELADEQSFRDRFRREVTAAQRVRRFCTASVLDAQLETEPLYVVTEYVAGPDLDVHIRRNGPMHGSSLEHLAVGVATALTAIHGAGIVHRDLKPANVLLSPVGPRVIDFGIARALDTMVAATRSGAFVGTPAYMAPEVIQGQEAGPPADVWAWGCVVAYAGTGNVPFSAANVPAILYQVMQGEPNLEGLDEGVGKLVRAALSRDPAARPTTQQLLESLTGQTRPDSERLAQNVSANWTPPPAAPQPQYAPRQPQYAPPQQQGYGPPQPAAFASPPVAPPTVTGSPRPRPGMPGNRRYLLAGAIVAGLALVAGAGLFFLSGDDGPPKGRLVYTTDFQKGTDTWYDFSTKADTGGVRRMQTDSTGYSGAYTGPDGYLPYRALLSVKVRNIKGPAYGEFGMFCFGPKSETDAYRFAVRSDGEGITLRKTVGKEISKTIASKKQAAGFTKSGDNTLSILCSREPGKIVLKAWLNGSLALEQSDREQPFVGPGVGGVLVQNSNDGKTYAEFDDFEIRDVG